MVAGAADSLACALGAGVTAPGPVSEMAGSSTCLNSVVAEPLPDLDISVYATPMGPAGYMTETGINTAGEALDWIAALGYGGRGARPRAADYERLDREAAAVPPGADGLLFIPVLGDGERDDPALRGTVTGLSLRHGRAAWARATMEGVAFGMRALVEVLGRDREPAAELRVSGQAASLARGTRSRPTCSGCRCGAFPATRPPPGWRCSPGSGPAPTPARTRPSPPPATRPNRSARPRRAGRYEAIYQRYRAVLASGLARRPYAGPGRMTWCRHSALDMARSLVPA